MNELRDSLYQQRLNIFNDPRYVAMQIALAEARRRSARHAALKAALAEVRKERTAARAEARKQKARAELWRHRALNRRAA